MISIQMAVNVIVTLVVAGLIFWLLWFLINYINPPDPFKKIANVVLMLLAVLVCIGALLSLLGGRPLFVADVPATAVTPPSYALAA